MFMVDAATAQLRRQRRATRTTTVRRFPAEAKMGMQRIQLYLGVGNSIVIWGLALKWIHDGAFPTTNFAVFMAVGYAALTLALVVGVVLDRLFIWPHEQGITASVAPLSYTEAFRSAKHYAEVERNGNGAEPILENLRVRFQRAGLLKEFEEALAICRNRP
jgi:hypothetical protein